MMIQYFTKKDKKERKRLNILVRKITIEKQKIQNPMLNLLITY